MSENKSHLSHNILFLREKERITQKEMGEKFGLTRDNIASYERGADPKIAALCLIASYFGLTLDQIVKDDLSKSKSDSKSLHQEQTLQVAESTPTYTPVKDDSAIVNLQTEVMELLRENRILWKENSILKLKRVEELV